MVFTGLEVFLTRSACLKNTVLGQFWAQKQGILRVLGQTNKDFLIKILPYDFRVHTMQIISHFTQFRLLIFKYDLLGGFGQFLAPVRVSSILAP